MLKGFEPRTDCALTKTIWGFRKLGVPYFGVLVIRILLFRVLYLGFPHFRELPYLLPRFRIERLGIQGLGVQGSIWVVVKIMAPFWVPIIIRDLLFRVPKKGP